jgi:putative transposase
MKRSTFSEEQIVYAIRQAEAGTPVGDLCRQLGGSDTTFYAWKKQYAHLGVSELRRLRQLEEEHSRLKRLVPDLSLDKHMLAEALRKKVYGPHAAENWPPGFTAPFRSVACGPVGWPSSVVPPGIDEAARRISPRYRYGFETSPMLARGLGICGFGCYCVARAGG